MPWWMRRKHLATKDIDGELRIFRNIAEDLKRHFPGVVFYLSGPAKKYNVSNEILYVTWEGGKKISKKEVERILNKYLMGVSDPFTGEFQPVLVPYITPASKRRKNTTK